MSCGVGCRRGSHLALLWHRPAATAPIRPLVWELPYAVGAALKRQKAKRKKKKRRMHSKPSWVNSLEKDMELEEEGPKNHFSDFWLRSSEEGPKRMFT